MRRILPAVGLFLLSPLVAEYLLGNIPITELSALIVLAPLYGGGALLIREAVRHRRRGWPSILILALAYGVFEEGIATMSLFNPNYVGLRLLDSGYVPFLGMGAPWTVLVLTLHVVWSIGVPVALVELLAAPRSTEPWMGRIGLAVTVVVFLLGAVAMTALSIFTSQFVASLPQLVLSALAAVALAATGLFLVPARTASSRETTAHGTASHLRRIPSPWLVGVGALLLSTAFKLLPLDWSPWLYVSLALGMGLVAIIAVGAWSRHPGWSDAHRLALVAGPLLTYAWTAFPQPPVLPADPAADLIGNAVFAVGALTLIAVAARKIQRRKAPSETDRAPRTSPESGAALSSASRPH